MFLSRQPNVGTVDDTPLTTVKAVLSEIIKALGGETVMQLLTSLRLSVTTMIFKWVCWRSDLYLIKSCSVIGDELRNYVLTDKSTLILVRGLLLVFFSFSSIICTTPCHPIRYKSSTSPYSLSQYHSLFSFSVCFSPLLPSSFLSSPSHPPSSLQYLFSLLSPPFYFHSLSFYDSIFYFTSSLLFSISNRLTGRISNLSLPTSQNFEESGGGTATSEELHDQLVLIIDDITSVRAAD